MMVDITSRDRPPIAVAPSGRRGLHQGPLAPHGTALLAAYWVGVRGLLEELRRAWERTDDVSSFLRLATDLIAFRLPHVEARATFNAERTVRMKDGIALTYRLNGGDLWSLREVWLFDAYRLPFDVRPAVVVDLGANIGLTSVWFAKRYGTSRIVAVEPDEANAQLAECNFRQNGVAATLIEAAVGPADGTAMFAVSDRSNLGRVGSSPDGRTVRMLSMETILGQVPDGCWVDLLKMDIEGGEQAVLDGDLTWLRRVDRIIAEFHPQVVDYDRLVDIVVSAGYRYIAAGTAFPGSMDSFSRVS